MVAMTLAWDRYLMVSESVTFNGTNQVDVIAHLTLCGISATHQPLTNTIAANIGTGTIHVGDRLFRDIISGPFATRLVTPAEAAQYYTLDKSGDQTDVVGLGVATVPTLLGGVEVNVDVTIRPTYLDTNYQAVAIVTGALSILAALSVVSTTIVNATTVRVRVRNTGLLSISGGSVLVSTIHN